MRIFFACILFWKFYKEEEGYKRDFKIYSIWKYMLFSHFIFAFPIILCITIIFDNNPNAGLPFIILTLITAVTHLGIVIKNGYRSFERINDEIKKEKNKVFDDMTWREAWEHDKKQMKQGIFLLDQGFLTMIVGFAGFAIIVYSLSQDFSLLPILVGLVLMLPSLYLLRIIIKDEDDKIEAMSNKYWQRREKYKEVIKVMKDFDNNN